MNLRISAETVRNEIAVPFAVLLFSLLLGASFAVLPPVLPIAALVGLATLVLVLRYPMVGLVLTMGFIYRAVPAQLAVEIPLGGFKAKPWELLLVLTAVSVSIKPAGKAIAYYGKPTMARIDIASAVLIATLLFVFLVSRLILGNQERAVIEARSYLALISLPLIPRILNSDEAWDRMIKVMIVMGAVIAAYVLIQMATGFNIMGGRLEDLDLSKNSGVRRSLLFGGAVVMFALYYLSETARAGNLAKTIPILMLIAAGIIGTFTRSLWVSAALGAMLVAFLNGGVKAIFRVTAVGVVAVSAGLALAAVIEPKVVSAAIDRAAGIATEFQSGESYGWRVRENDFAFKAITDHPLTGVGLGGRYKPIEWSKGAFENADYFIHNAYVATITKMGALGILFLGTIIFLYRSAWKSGGKPQDSKYLQRRNSFAGVMLGFLLGGFVSPSFLTFHGFLFLAICIVGTFHPSRVWTTSQK